MSRIHRLKTWSEVFQDVKWDRKPFEIRFNDRDYRKDDFLVLDEWDNLLKQYTTNEPPLVRVVTYVMKGGRFGLAEGYVAMAIDKLAARDVERVLLAVAPPREDLPTPSKESP